MEHKVYLTFLLFLIVIPLSLSDSCSFDISIDISDGVRFPNGVIKHHGVRYQPTEYFYDNVTRTYRGCFCLKEKCARKCCDFGYGYDKKEKKCVKTEEIFDPPVGGYNGRLKSANASSMFHFLHGKRNCNQTKRIVVSQLTENYHLLNDGKLLIELKNTIPRWTVRTQDQYCLDTFIYEDSSGAKFTKLDALICFPEDKADTHYVLSSVCMLISCVFILLTVSVYAWLPELRNTVHGRVLMTYLLCLLVGFTFLATMQIMLTINNINETTCVAFTFIIYYFLLTAFFWQNVMCFDIWWTFSGKRGLSFQRLSIRGRFDAYALYSFSIPTVLTILMVSLEYSGLEPHPLLPLLPRLRLQGCFLHGTSKLFYLYGPIILLCFANLVFFILTAIRIAQINKETSVLKSKESATHDQHSKDKQRLLLYIKLFLVMGINWSLEVISAIYPEANYIWQYTDAYNVLIGFTIFVIFVCKRKMFRLIKKRVFKEYRHDSIPHQNGIPIQPTPRSANVEDSDHVDTDRVQHR